MNTDLLHRFRWPLVALAGIAAAVWVVVAGFGEQLGVSHVLAEQVSDAAAWVGSVAIPFLIRLALRDSDGDGDPDLTDPTPHGTPVPPAPRPPREAVAMLLAACVGAAALGQGCAYQPTPTQRVLTGAEVGKASLELADVLIREHCTTAAVEATDDPPAAADRCLRAAAAQRLAVESWEITLHGVLASTEPDGGLNLETLKPFLAPFFDAYRDLSQLVELVSGRKITPFARILGDFL